ncbi:hypothetical protein B9S53_18990 [Arthrospira sp. O9.13F]|nr:hypothetical protein B9S53_18990 [Arthrospira sp. O9.13F]
MGWLWETQLSGFWILRRSHPRLVSRLLEAIARWEVRLSGFLIFENPKASLVGAGARSATGKTSQLYTPARGCAISHRKHQHHSHTDHALAAKRPETQRTEEKPANPLSTGQKS